MSAALKPRPKYYDLNLAHLPPAGLVSIIHRVSGALLFLFIPVVLCVMQQSLASEEQFRYWKSFFTDPVVKLIGLGFVWLYAHHFFAGIRYLLLDVHIGIAQGPSGTSAKVVLALGVATTLAIGWRLW